MTRLPLFLVSTVPSLTNSSLRFTLNHNLPVWMENSQKYPFWAENCQEWWEASEFSWPWPSVVSNLSLSLSLSLSLASYNHPSHLTFLSQQFADGFLYFPRNNNGLLFSLFMDKELHWGIELVFHSTSRSDIVWGFFWNYKNKRYSI